MEEYIKLQVSYLGEKNKTLGITLNYAELE